MRPVGDPEERSDDGPTEEPNGGQGRGRTADTAIFSRVLYQLSYLTAAASGEAGNEMADSKSTGADLTGFEPATFTLTG